MPDDLVDYLRSQRDAYTRAALTQRAIDGGYSRWQVEAAWDRLETEDERAWRPAPRPLMRFVAMLVIAVIVVTYGFAIYAAVDYMLSTGMYSPSPVGQVVLGLYAVAMIAAGLASIRLTWRAPSRVRAVTSIAGAIALSAVAWVGLAGLCIAGLSMPFRDLFVPS